MNTIITHTALKLAIDFRNTAERRDRAWGTDQYKVLQQRLRDIEQAAKANGLAYALLTEISSHELTHLIKSLRHVYRYERTRGGYRCRHYIRTNDRYSVKATIFWHMTDAEADSDERNPLIAIRGIRRIESKLQPAIAA